MKKTIMCLLAIVNLLTINANAAWEFDEKVILEDTGNGIYRAHVEDNYIVVTVTTDYGVGYSVSPYKNFDFAGNELINKANTINRTNKTEYFTHNRRSLITTDEDGTTLTDLSGNVLATGFERQWSYDDIARVIKNENGYGLMAYDGRIIIPMENEDISVWNKNIYLAKNNGVTDVYNYDGDKLFTLDEGTSFVTKGSEELATVINDEVDKYALINFNGEYLTGFDYEHIYVYENNEPWQSGTFISLDDGNGKKYVDINLSEIDIFSEDSVYCRDYAVCGDIVAINNGDFSAVYNKNSKEYMIPFRQGKTLLNSMFLVHIKNKNSYLYDLNGAYIKNLNCYVTDIGEFEDGIAMVNEGKMFYDTKGNNIFPKWYDASGKIDNNEFVVKDGKYLKLLTAKGIIGEALNTDVKIDINGYQIPCYSVYGYAVIKAEDLRYFGFDVEWNGEERMLYISRNPEYYDITATYFGESGETGTHYDDIYGSDINVEYNGKRLSSYCINGVTLIKPEDLVAEGITFNYDNSQRTLFMTVDRLERK